MNPFNYRNVASYIRQYANSLLVCQSGFWVQRFRVRTTLNAETRLRGRSRYTRQRPDTRNLLIPDSADDKIIDSRVCFIGEFNWKQIKRMNTTGIDSQFSLIPGSQPAHMHK